MVVGVVVSIFLNFIFTLFFLGGMMIQFDEHIFPNGLKPPSMQNDQAEVFGSLVGSKHCNHRNIREQISKGSLIRQGTGCTTWCFLCYFSFFRWDFV